MRRTAYITRKAKIDMMLARLTALSDDHFNVAPDKATWADVGVLSYYAELLKRITDSAFKEGEHARLKALSDDHFNVAPDKATRADVGVPARYAELLKRTTDSAFKEGEHAS